MLITLNSSDHIEENKIILFVILLSLSTLSVISFQYNLFQKHCTFTNWQFLSNSYITSVRRELLVRECCGCCILFMGLQLYEILLFRLNLLNEFYFVKIELQMKGDSIEWEWIERNRSSSSSHQRRISLTNTTILYTTAKPAQWFP